MLLGNGLRLEYVILKLLLCFPRVHHKERNQEHSLVLILQLLKQCLRILPIGCKIRGDDVHVVPGTDCLLLLLDFGAVQLGDRVLNRLDCLVLVN